MWILVGLGLFILAALFLIAVALHDGIEETLAGMLMFAFLSFLGTIAFSALQEWKVPSKAALIESAQLGLVFAFGMGVIGFLALIVSAPIRMISHAIANRNCASCAQFHARLHQPSRPTCPECVEYHEQDHENGEESLEYDEESL